MSSNSFGSIFRYTSWGESHGKAIGVVIDGCPAGLSICAEEINQALHYRAPGHSKFTSPRKESDSAEIYSGVFEGVTTGAPISIIIMNNDADSSKYEAIKDLIRPGHANYTYLEKYGVFDYKGGGRASARETAARVAAGAVAEKLLDANDIKIVGYIKQIGDHTADIPEFSAEKLLETTRASAIFCPDATATKTMGLAIRDAVRAGDSLGGLVEFIAVGLPAGLGDPVYEKLSAKLASGMMSIPAAKGFEMGEGFNAAQMTGSEHNDIFSEGGNSITQTNHAGGTLGGISTGMPIVGRVAFKPTSSILTPQETIDTKGAKQVFELPKGSRHDPCVAIRGVPVVEAMAKLVIADALLMNRCAKL